MTLERLIAGAKNFGIKAIACAGIGLTLAFSSGCAKTVEERADIESYSKHRVGVVDLMSKPGEYLDRRISLTATPVESNVGEEYLNTIYVMLKEEDQYLLCFSGSGGGGHYEGVAMADITLDTIIAENKSGRMLQAVVNGVLRKDERGYWLELSSVKKLNEDIYFNVGAIKEYTKWVEEEGNRKLPENGNQ